MRLGTTARIPLTGRGTGVRRAPSMSAISCIGVEFLEPADHLGAQARIWFLDATGQVVRPCRLVPAPIAKLRGQQLQRFFGGECSLWIR